MDWTSVIVSEPSEEEEMSSLIAGFAARMRNQAAGSEGETTPRSGWKQSKQSSQDEEAQKD